MISSLFAPLWEVVAPRVKREDSLLLMLEQKQEELALKLLDDAAASSASPASDDAGIDLGFVNEGGNSLLHVASAYGLTRVCDRLAAIGASLDSVSSNNLKMTALHFAADRNHPACCASLLAAGASPDVRNARGETAEDMAKGKEHAAVAAVFAEHRLARLPTAVYTAADQTRETVRVVKKHSEAEGGGFTIFIPSLGRERQTVEGRLELIAANPEASQPEPKPTASTAEGAGAKGSDSPQAEEGGEQEQRPEVPSADDQVSESPSAPPPHPPSPPSSSDAAPPTTELPSEVGGVAEATSAESTDGGEGGDEVGGLEEPEGSDLSEDEGEEDQDGPGAE